MLTDRLWLSLIEEGPPLVVLVLLGLTLLSRRGPVRVNLGRHAIRLLAAGWVLIFLSFIIDIVDEFLFTQVPTWLIAMRFLEGSTQALGIGLIALGLLRSGRDISRNHQAYLAMHREVQHHEQQYQTLQHLARQLSQDLYHTGCIEEGLDKTLHSIRIQLEIEGVSLWQRVAGGPALQCINRNDASGQDVDQGPGDLALDPERYPDYFAAQAREGLVAVENAMEDPRTRELRGSYLEPRKIQALLDAAVWDGQGIQMILCLESRRPRRWSRMEKTFAGNIAHLLSATLAAQAEREAAKSLRTSEARFRAIADYTYDWESWFDTQGRLLWTNPAAERLSGYPCQALYAMSDPLTLVDSKHRLGIQAALEAGMKGESGSDLEFRLLTRDGGQRPVQLSWQPIKDDQGHFQGVRTSIRDISEQVRQREQLGSAMRELRRSSARLQLHFNLSPMAIVSWQPDGRILDLNPKAEQLFGLPRSDLAGADIRLFIPEQTDARITSLVDQLREPGARVHKLQTNCNLEGELLSLDWTEVGIMDESQELESILSFGLDVSEQQRVERAFQAVFQATTRNTGPGFLDALVRELVTTLDTSLAFVGEFEEVNQTRVASVASYKDDGERPAVNYDLKGTPCEQVNQEGICVYPENIQERFPQDLMLQEMGLHSYAGTLLHNDRDEPIGLLVLLDTKPLKHRRLIETLLPVFASRAGAELEALRQRRRHQRLEDQVQHSQRMETLGILTGGIAQDFNNLLQPISGYADLLLEDLPADSPRREDLRLIKESSERARSLIRQMLTFARASDFQVESLEVTGMLADVQQLARGFLPPGIELNLEQTEELPSILGNRTQLDQALLNLITNAAHAIGERGQIHLRARIVRVDEARAQSQQPLAPGRYLQLEVADDGCGMETALKERIFDPFFTTKEPGEGTGLGLSTTLGIVHAHGGGIEVDSEPGQGACFRLLLPADSLEGNHQQEPGPSAPSPRPPASDGRILP